MSQDDAPPPLPRAEDVRRDGPHPHLVFALAITSAVAWGLTALYFAGGRGRFDVVGYSKGQDFINVWTAGHMVAEGRAQEVFVPGRFLQATRALFDPSLPPHLWSYPPTALFPTIPLGFTSYFTGLLVWSVAGLALVAWTAWLVFPGRTERLLLLASPAVAINLVMGQNGALTAALWLLGAALLQRRPTVAGALFGLMTFKPQLGLLIPVALVAGRHRRAIVAACVSAALLAAAAAAAFGLPSWRAFLGLTLPTQFSSMALWNGPFQWFYPSTFMAARLVGLTHPLALAAQAPFTLLGAGLVWRAYRRAGDPLLSAALLFVATFVATPQGSAYDMIPVAAAALVLARRGRGLADGVLTVLLWIAPWAMMPLNALHIPLTPLLLTWASLRLAALPTLDETPDRALAPSVRSEAT
jgi:alpha-1,2-mannosyltransferase